MEKIRRMPQNYKSRRETREKKRIRIRYFDYNLLAVIIFLICFGLIMLYSASAYSAMLKSGEDMFYLKRQSFFFATGFLIMYVISRIDYHKYKSWAKKIYAASIFLMFLVQTPLGKEVKGARRWLRLPFDQQFQPSEIAKFAVILLIPVVICKVGREINSFRGIVKVLAWGAISSGFIFFCTENLSTAIIVFGISCSLVFVAHPKTAPFLAAASFVLFLCITGARLLGGLVQTADLGNKFRLRRVLVWLSPEKYASDWGFQVMQGLYAVGSGGFFGKGLGNSAQKMIIPEVQNDMILSVICEELGIFGAAVVLALFGFLLYRLLFIARNAPDTYGSLIAAGIFSHIALQVILNVMVVINLIPTTGVTLPFISYGGTSAWFLMAEMGLAMGISRAIKFEE